MSLSRDAELVRPWMQENTQLKAKLAQEHENFLAVHRDNQRTADRIAELNGKLAHRDRIIEMAETIIRITLKIEIEQSKFLAGFGRAVLTPLGKDCEEIIDAIEELKKT